jgi:hypothetical protein
MNLSFSVTFSAFVFRHFGRRHQIVASQPTASIRIMLAGKGGHCVLKIPSVASAQAQSWGQFYGTPFFGRNVFSLVGNANNVHA